MIGLDTNVLVRYFVQDDEVQAETATNLIESLSADKPGFVSLVTLVELVWVMQRCFKVAKPTIADVLISLVRSKEIIVADAEIVWKAIRLYRDTKADFADSLIERIGHDAGCEYTVTFDQGAANKCGMKLLD